MNITIKGVKEKINSKFNELIGKQDDIFGDLFCATLGATIGLTIVCCMQQNEINGLKKMMNTELDSLVSQMNNNNAIINRNFTTIFSSVKTLSDKTGAGFQAVADGLKSTHPAIEDLMANAIIEATK